MKPSNPDKMAVSMHWDKSGAPKVTAKGRGELADRIIALATAHDVPIKEDKALAALLLSVELGDEIPRELYVAVAEVIAFAYALKDELNL